MVSSETSTTLAQRIILWFIAIFMVLGTIGSFVMIVYANENGKKDQAKADTLKAEYQAQYDEYQAKVDAQALELSGKYFGTLQPFSSRVGVFDKGSVTELKSEDLVVGTGEEITADSTFTAYYIGWNPDGKVFDQSIDGTKLKAPFAVSPGSVITGWSEGVVGMRIGGIRELTIPADKAYGETGSGQDIAPNSPIKFVVMIIETPATIAQPIPSQALIEYYQSGKLQ